MSSGEEWVPDDASEESEVDTQAGNHDPSVEVLPQDQQQQQQLPPPPPQAETSSETRSRKRGRLPPPPGMIPDSLVDYVIDNLTTGNENEVSETLLQLARVFREQAELCLQQAHHLDRMATLEQEPGAVDQAVFVDNVPTESMSTRLGRQNVQCFAEESADLLLECHEKLDAIETGLVPWDQKMDPSERPQKSGLSSYNVYLQEQFDGVASRLGTTSMTVVGQEITKSWNSLTAEEKQEYKERMIAINKERSDAKKTRKSEKQEGK